MKFSEVKQMWEKAIECKRCDKVREMRILK